MKAEGESSAAPLFYKWAGARCTGADKMIIDFTEASSNEGRKAFLDGLVDMGVTSVPATKDELDAAPETTHRRRASSTHPWTSPAWRSSTTCATR